MDFVGEGSNLDNNWHGSLRQELNHLHIREIPTAQDTFVVNLCAVAALTWVLYDMILCFEQEVSLVWWRWREHKGRHTRRIYVIVRYFSILNLAQDLSQNTGVGVGTLAVLTTGTPHPSIVSPTMGCPLGSPKYHPIITLAAWIPSVAAQGIYFLMMLATFVQVLQDLDSNGKASSESLLQVRRLVPTMIAFITNGSSYFLIAISTFILPRRTLIF
ncbi:hypothetical protein BYT27DRAFT_7194945 [Phlegmacium glaucopus]|nr:hypothetical protein BYT27DRAFT_7194945 [Phlegmacium glaucopus]